MKSGADDGDVGSLGVGNGLSPEQTIPLHGAGNGKHLHCKSPRV